MSAKQIINGNVGKYTINLLQPELLPKKVFLTLTRVATIWCFVLVLMVAWAIKTTHEQQSLQVTLTTLKQENRALKNKQNELTSQLTARKVDSALAEKLTTVKMLLNNKQALHAKLTNPNKTFVTGFAAAMEDLAQLHHQGIRLEEININNDNMTFTGVALTPEAVPAWLAGFESSVLLSGKSFSRFKLSENEQGLTEFMVSSRDSEVTEHE